VFTARYALSPYIKQIRFVFKGLKLKSLHVAEECVSVCAHARARACGIFNSIFDNSICGSRLVPLRRCTEILSRTTISRVSLRNFKNRFF
jgi:hypothetical protein